MPPRYLNTPADVDAAIQLGHTTEGIHLDFKEAINGFATNDSQAREKARKELCRDVTQFANHLGGCLLVGISETTNPQNLKVAASFVPVQDPDKLREWIEQAITNYCVPHTFSKYIEIIPHPNGTLLAINVPPSRLPVVLWDRQDHTIQAIGRNNHGKTYLNPDELERLRMNGSRAAKISFEDAISRVRRPEVELVGGVLRVDSSMGRWMSAKLSGRIFLGSHDESTFDLRVPVGGSIPVLSVPYGLIRECWVNVLGELTLLLDAHVIWGEDRLTFATTLLDVR
jgi:Putative DNA-binding domain